MTEVGEGDGDVGEGDGNVGEEEETINISTLFSIDLFKLGGP